MKTFIFNFGLVWAQFQLFDDDGSILVDGNQYDDFSFGFMDAFGRSQRPQLPPMGPPVGPPLEFGPISGSPVDLYPMDFDPIDDIATPDELGRAIQRFQFFWLTDSKITEI